MFSHLYVVYAYQHVQATLGLKGSRSESHQVLITTPLIIINMNVIACTKAEK